MPRSMPLVSRAERRPQAPGLKERRLMGGLKKTSLGRPSKQREGGKS